MELIDRTEHEEEGIAWVTELYGIDGIIYATNTYRREEC